MARISVQYMPGVMEATGKKAEIVELPHPDLPALVDALLAKYGSPLKEILIDPATGKRSRYILVAINGILTHDHDAPLQDGDQVMFSPVLAGG
jgi:molybdopterin converting factor small subunit